MTNKEILDDFRSKYKIPLADYRPLCVDFVKDMEGITIWTEEGDVILYFPKRKTGRWIHKGGGSFICSDCGEMVGLNTYRSEQAGEIFRYCPHCGARMKGDENEID